MATNDFLPFAGGAGANVLTQADYLALAARTPGFGSGILPSENLNKVLRQGTVMAAVLAQWIADNSGDNVVDDGTTATIEASFTAALAALGLRSASTAQTGVVQLADNATAQALTDMLKVLTPATLKSAFQGSNQLLAASGYQKIPGGLILQWGRVSSVAAGSSTPVSLPTTFPNTFASVVANPDDGGVSASYRLNAVKGGGLGTFSIVNTYTSALAAHWYALGY